MSKRFMLVVLILSVTLVTMNAMAENVAEVFRFDNEITWRSSYTDLEEKYGDIVSWHDYLLDDEMRRTYHMQLFDSVPIGYLKTNNWDYPYKVVIRDRNVCGIDGFQYWFEFDVDGHLKEIVILPEHTNMSAEVKRINKAFNTAMTQKYGEPTGNNWKGHNDNYWRFEGEPGYAIRISGDWIYYMLEGDLNMEPYTDIPGSEITMNGI